MKAAKLSSFAAKIASKRGEYTYLVSGTHGEREYWCVLLVDQLKLDIFKHRLGGSIRVQDYGTILRWGYGKTPPPNRLYDI